MNKRTQITIVRAGLPLLAPASLAGQRGGVSVPTERAWIWEQIGRDFCEIANDRCGVAPESVIKVTPTR